MTRLNFWKHVSELGIFVPSTSVFNIITVGHMKRIGHFEQAFLRIHCFEFRTVSFLTLLPSCDLCDSIYTVKSMIMQRVISRHPNEFGTMFSGDLTTTFGASICHLSSLLVSARVLDDVRGISCFVILT